MKQVLLNVKSILIVCTNVINLMDQKARVAQRNCISIVSWIISGRFTPSYKSSKNETQLKEVGITRLITCAGKVNVVKRKMPYLIISTTLYLFRKIRGTKKQVNLNTDKTTVDLKFYSKIGNKEVMKVYSLV